MKCKICGRKTKWDFSFGSENFIVCPKCFNKLGESLGGDLYAIKVVHAIGRIADKSKKCKKD